MTPPKEIETLFAALAATAQSLASTSTSAFSLPPTALRTLLVLLQCRVLLPTTTTKINALVLAAALSTKEQTESLSLQFARLTLSYLTHPTSFEPPVSPIEQYLICLCFSLNPQTLRFEFSIPTHLLQTSPDNLTTSIPAHAIASEINHTLSLRCPTWHHHLHSLGISCVLVPRVFLIPSFDIDEPDLDAVSLDEAMEATIDILGDSEDLYLWEEDAWRSGSIEFEMPDLVPMPAMDLPGLDEYIWAQEPDPAEIKSRSEATRLLKLAFERPLRNAETKAINTLIESTPTFWLEYGGSLISSTSFPTLVEMNPKVCAAIVQGLMSVHAADEFLETLLTTPLTLSAMDVVNTLVSHLETSQHLPENFTNRYISHVCQQCGVSKDKTNQALPITSEFEVEMEAFCLQFAWVKEASDLFRLVKRWETQTQ
ncbi:hypothetical protein HDU98_011681 [Podochytrium sp. JEL0797]|nr:hypothetical protein HDU98_011681 [Podochytrium sp. JEL0797]